MLGRVCRWAPLSTRCATRHASNCPFSWRPARGGSLSIINGTDVTLGDSVIGVGVLAWAKQLTPCPRIELFRSRTTPSFVERLYELANEVVDVVPRLPRTAGSLPKDVVDLSDFLHWPSFAAQQMVDFFAAGIGLVPASIPPAARANRWLARLPLPPLNTLWRGRPYVLLCAEVSTPLRTCPRLSQLRWSRRYGGATGFQCSAFGRSITRHSATFLLSRSALTTTSPGRGQPASSSRQIPALFIRLPASMCRPPRCSPASSRRCGFATTRFATRWTSVDRARAASMQTTRRHRCRHCSLPGPKR